VLVESVMDSSPAARAGLQTGDVIVGFGASQIANIDDLHRLLTRDAIDVATALVVIRAGGRLELPITPVEAAA
jgi:serine protease Do